MAQNAISGKLKLKNFWESVFPDSLPLETIGFLSYTGSLRPPSTECLQTPLYSWVKDSITLTQLSFCVQILMEDLYINVNLASKFL